MYDIKLYCKRTFFRENQNAFNVLGKGYGEKYVAYKKGEIYNARLPHENESKLGILYYVESEYKPFASPINKKNFDKYFIRLDDYREKKINDILK